MDLFGYVWPLSPTTSASIMKQLVRFSQRRPLPSKGIPSHLTSMSYHIICADGISLLLSSIEFHKVLPNKGLCQGNPLFSNDDSFLFFRANIGETEVLKNILDTYEAALGQAINLNKSKNAFISNPKMFSFLLRPSCISSAEAGYFGIISLYICSGSVLLYIWFEVLEMTNFGMAKCWMRTGF